MDAGSIMQTAQGRAGWDDTRALDIVLQYIDRQGANDAFADFLRELTEEDGDGGGTLTESVFDQPE